MLGGLLGVASSRRATAATAAGNRRGAAAALIGVGRPDRPALHSRTTELKILAAKVCRWSRIADLAGRRLHAREAAAAPVATAGRSRPLSVRIALSDLSLRASLVAAARARSRCPIAGQQPRAARAAAHAGQAARRHRSPDNCRARRPGRSAPARSRSLGPLPVRDVLLLLFRGTPFSAVFDPGVPATFIGELSQPDAAAGARSGALSSGPGLRHARHASIRASRRARDPPVRGRSSRHPPRPHGGRRRWRPTASRRALTATVESDLFGELDRRRPALLSPAGRHHVDRRAGLVHVTDFADRLHQVAIFSRRCMCGPRGRCGSYARVLEITLGDAAPRLDRVASRAGIEHPARRRRRHRIDDFDGLMRALATAGCVRVSRRR